MLFMNQDRIYGRRFRDESGGDGDAGGAPNSGEGDGGDAAALKSQLDALQGQFDAVAAKNNELLGEAKKAKAARREADATAAAAVTAQAAADGNYEQLFKSSETERESLASQLAEVTSSNQRKEVNAAAFKISGELADGANIELLSEFVSRRLKFADDGVKVVDDSGNLTISSLDDLRKEIAGSARYASLLKGNQSSGGGAAGGSSGVGGSKEMTRTEFDALDPVAKSKFMKGGGKITR